MENSSDILELADKTTTKKKKKDRSGVNTKAFRTELLLSNSDKAILDSQSKICNWTYNQLLDASIVDYAENDGTLNLCDGRTARNYMVSNLKSKHNFLKTVSSSALKNAALRLGESYKNFFSKRCGFPKFKSWQREWFSLTYDEPNCAGAHISGKTLKIGLGKNEAGKNLSVELKLKHAIPYKNYKLNTLEITKERGVYFVCISVDIPKTKEVTSDSKRWVTIDPNHKNLITALDHKGNTFQFSNPDCLTKLDIGIDILKAKLSQTRKQKITKIYDEKKEYVKTEIIRASKKHIRYAKALADLRHTRQEQIKQSCRTIANWLCENYDYIVFGDYTPSTQTATHENMRRKMLSQSMIGKLRTTVQNTAKLSYKTFVKTDETNSSKKCSFCSHEKKKDPSIRQFTCESCGNSFDRDVNSCLNFAVSNGLITDIQNFFSFDMLNIKHLVNLTKRSFKISEIIANNYCC